MGMECPKCGSRMGVSNTAGAQSNRVYLLDQVSPFIESNTNEFVARDRRCSNPNCRHAVLTVELDVEDFIGALRYAQIDSPALTQSIIDWSRHIRENARTFKCSVVHPRPENQREEKGGTEAKGLPRQRRDKEGRSSGRN